MNGPRSGNAYFDKGVTTMPSAKFSLIETAWKSFRGGTRPHLRPDFERFVVEHGYWLDD